MFPAIRGCETHCLASIHPPIPAASRCQYSRGQASGRSIDIQAVLDIHTIIAYGIDKSYQIISVVPASVTV